MKYRNYFPFLLLDLSFFSLDSLVLELSSFSINFKINNDCGLLELISDDNSIFLFISHGALSKCIFLHVVYFLMFGLLGQNLY